MNVNSIPSRPVVTTAPSSDKLARVRRIVSGAGGTLSRDELLTDMKWGVISGVPMEAMTNSQAYRRGEMSASKYTATILANSLGFGAWTIGGALATAALAPVGLPAFALGVAGFAAGMLANDIWDRTFGKAIVKVVSGALPERASKPFADGFTKFIANPFIDHVWNPITKAVTDHKLLAAGLAGGAMLLPPLRPVGKALAREAGVWVGGSVVAMGTEWAVLNRLLPPAEEATPAKDGSFDAETIKTVQDAYNMALAKFKEKGATDAQADAAVQKWLTQTLQDNGASLPDAQALVKAALDALKAKQAPAKPAA